VSERKLSFAPISASDSNSNPRNTQCIPAVKIFPFLEREQNCTFFKGLYSFILRNVTIGENSVVGAGSVVTKDIPARVLMMGNLARVIREIQNKVNA